MNKIEAYLLDCSNQITLIQKPRVSIEWALYGKCDIFALALKRKFGFEYMAAVEDRLLHAWAVRKDGSWVDAAGTLTQNIIDKNYAPLLDLSGGIPRHIVFIKGNERDSIWRGPRTYPESAFRILDKFLENNRNFYEYDSGRITRYDEK